ncbi:16S rRNA (cytidine(1402)-2'-O)-methyltransferase [Pseudoalteromonas tunicata]|jgi:16S rRNA (cytidine1402-2'-O)-methyltransferase|uniref:Ribosomal RNA small subunit methyltransferase I n=1 Tax=Pseudoalteromonas tunicata D2 TaxID=87626 RepID=A4C8B1_9GAMM|nr:16S rRNA (cytidine(1402)-2'-O)-methyltransferase [Pseudoalteromonas tunicata]ATC93331.1 16S rRNA (cytidine1402-2'-O)-methyltransferase [Pseudoalteromonas tunicata]AXT32382.1 16S rRNA (cytidine(1402)-2'-O)-methyltransferase [Pseudoalteromonas tunicata]EAR28826.1 putative methyltransferase [Pseudoalteromonas tunicata D2]MDP4983065.1 16S rRNA (cytidine(1402)-2'-O)-methyltransferase [Pseudoalteromonas tunicata]MDP5213510.1 16S rRNA (cytidine(1402)-2'-O)-methyltransferase [Pseudoalteromonas tuni
MLNGDKSNKIGTLYVVATPIGNLDDISQRAIATLSSVDLIAAEDTRHTGKLLSHLSIKAKTFALHDHNEKQKAQQIVNWLNEGLDVALVSDAGTPLISDPGYSVVSLCREQGAKVTPVPGACAAIAAVSCSGLPTDRFQFLGFSPAKSKARQDFFLSAYESGMTSIIYESTHRIMASLDDIEHVLGAQQQVVLAKELTKTFETFFSGTVVELREFLTEDPTRQRGEIVLMLPGKEKQPEEIPADARRMLSLLEAEMPMKKACGIVADYFGIKKNALYKAVLADKDEE